MAWRSGFLPTQVSIGRPLAGLISTCVSFFGFRPDRSSARAVVSFVRAGTADLVDFAVSGNLSGLLVFDEFDGFFVLFIMSVTLSQSWHYFDYPI